MLAASLLRNRAALGEDRRLTLDKAEFCDTDAPTNRPDDLSARVVAPAVPVFRGVDAVG